MEILSQFITSGSQIKEKSMKASETIQQIYRALRGLFQDKAELKGVDDWDTLIGILLRLEQLHDEVEELENKGE